jgi:GT2 family glycosyltransferase
VSVIHSNENEGFGRACNRAMTDLTGVDYVALINNDAFPEPGWLAPLVGALEGDPGLGAVSPKVLLDVRAAGVVLVQTAQEPAVLTVGDVCLGDEPVGDRLVADERFRPAIGGRPFQWSSGRPEAGVWWSISAKDTAGRVRLSAVADRTVDVVLSTPVDRAVVTLDRAPAVVELQLPDQPENVINSVGGVLYDGWFGGDRGYLELDRGQYDQPAEVFSWSGAAVLLRSDFLRDVGAFNPAFFLYYEDVELSWRGRLKGWRYATVPPSVVRHKHGFATGVGSPRFQAWEDRSRWMTLAELAPASAALRAIGGGVRRGLARGEGLSALAGLWPALRGRKRLATDRHAMVTIREWSQARPGDW